ncbi:hypothetical protein DMENIID0001_154130 [Sergentomyia squamirostris]
MSFPKAKLKRFNDITVFSSPFGGKKDNSASKKSKKNGSASDLTDDPKTDSKTKSSAYRLFRTPSLPRRLKFRSTSDSTPKKTPSCTKTSVAGIIPLPVAIQQKEALHMAATEINHKNQRLAECEKMVTVLRTKYDKAADDNAILRIQLDAFIRKIEEADKSNQLLEKIAKGSILKIKELEEERSHIVGGYEKIVKQLEETIDKSAKECKDKDETIEYFQLENGTFLVALQQYDYRIERLMDEKMNLLRENAILVAAHKEDKRQMTEELQQLRENAKNFDMQLLEAQKRIKTLESDLEDEGATVAYLHDDLESCQTEIEQLDLKLKETESVAVLERAKLLKTHIQQLAEMEKNKMVEIEKIHEMTEEKIRIAGIQAEERIRTLDRDIETAVNRETTLWRSELNRCQKIAENEIIQIECEKNDLRTLLDEANELLRTKDCKITELENLLRNEDDINVTSKRETESELKKLQEAYQKLLTEKHNYQLTLENTRSTVGILMERLKRSDTDVEVLNLENSSMNCENERLKEQILRLEDEKEELRSALEALRNSSMVLQTEMKTRETLFKQLINSESQTLDVVDKLGKMFMNQIDEGTGKYSEMYADLKKRCDIQETYIKDMKSLLEEFSNGIELARIELDIKDQKLNDLEEENRTIKLESMQYKFKCQQFETESSSGRADGGRPPNPSPDQTLQTSDDVEPTQAVHDLLQELEKEIDDAVETEQHHQMHMIDDFVDWNTNHAHENVVLKEKLVDMTKRVEELEAQLKDGLTCSSGKRFECYREDNMILKERISQLEYVTRDQESTITVLKGLIDGNPPASMSAPTTPNKLQRKHLGGTPKTPKSLFGKENHSPAMVKILRERNN